MSRLKYFGVQSSWHTQLLPLAFPTLELRQELLSFGLTIPMHGRAPMRAKLRICHMRNQLCTDHFVPKQDVYSYPIFCLPFLLADVLPAAILLVLSFAASLLVLLRHSTALLCLLYAVNCNEKAASLPSLRFSTTPLVSLQAGEGSQPPHSQEFTARWMGGVEDRICEAPTPQHSICNIPLEICCLDGPSNPKCEILRAPPPATLAPHPLGPFLLLPHLQAQGLPQITLPLHLFRQLWRSCSGTQMAYLGSGSPCFQTMAGAFAGDICYS